MNRSNLVKLNFSTWSVDNQHAKRKVRTWNGESIISYSKYFFSKSRCNYNNISIIINLALKFNAEPNIFIIQYILIYYILFTNFSKWNDTSANFFYCTCLFRLSIWSHMKLLRNNKLLEGNITVRSSNIRSFIPASRIFDELKFYFFFYSQTFSLIE